MVLDNRSRGAIPDQQEIYLRIGSVMSLEDSVKHSINLSSHDDLSARAVTRHGHNSLPPHSANSAHAVTRQRWLLN